MLGGKVNTLPNHIQSVYVQNILKILSIIMKEESSELAVEVSNIAYRPRIKGVKIIDENVSSQVCEIICNKLPQFVSSGDLEVQERASSALHLVSLIRDEIAEGNVDILDELCQLFNGELNPVAPKAQRKVQVPEGYVLWMIYIIFQLCTCKNMSTNWFVKFWRLNLDEWINDPPSSSSSESEDERYEDEDAPNIFMKCDQEKEENKYEPSEEELEKVNI